MSRKTTTNKIRATISRLKCLSDLLFLFRLNSSNGCRVLLVSFFENVPRNLYNTVLLKHLFSPFFQICIPVKEDPYYKCICKAGFESELQGSREKCVIANRSQFLLYGQQKPGVVRGLDIKSPRQVSGVRFY